MAPRLAMGALALLFSTAAASRDFLLNASLSESVVSARALELQPSLQVIPRGFTFTEPRSSDCKACQAFQWTSTYGFVALNARGANVAVDGLNERGLSAAWVEVEHDERSRTRTLVRNAAKPAVASVCSYLLGNFATVGEVRRGLARFQIATLDERMQALVFGGRVPPHHVSVRDAEGKNLVIQLSGSKVKVVDGMNQVLPRDPSMVDRMEDSEADDEAIVPAGFVAVEQFLRLWVFNHDATNETAVRAAQLSDEQREVSMALHVLTSATRPLQLGDTAQWSVVRDHKRRKLHVKSKSNRKPHVIDLNRFNLSVGAHRKLIPLTFGDWFVPATPTPPSQDGPKAATMNLWFTPTVTPKAEVSEDNILEMIKEVFESNPSTTFWSGAVSGALAVLVVLRFFSLVHIDTRIRLYRSGSVFRRAARSVRSLVSWRR